ncbi:MAG: hypothetical protein K6G00_06485 [Treponema sp.]|nr:hypothetical protein [Treponema sp.]
MKNCLIPKLIFIIVSSAFFYSCSSKQKGYSVSAPVTQSSSSQKNSNSSVPSQTSVSQDNPQDINNSEDILTQDEEFLAMVEKMESGEISQEPPRNQEYVAPPEVEIPEGDILEIKERLFLTQINDIYFNYDRYKDKTIVVEGMFTYLVSYLDNSQFPAVYRRGPGCCGNDGWGGFMLDYEGPFPEPEAWIKVVGKPIMKEYKGYQDLYLKVLSFEVKTERGLEFVVN